MSRGRWAWMGTLALVGLGAAGWVGRDLPAHWLVVRDAAGPADAAVVLAGDPDYERTQAASRLVLKGEAHWLVLTGGFPGPGDGVSSLRKVALDMGVPADRILEEKTSLSTREAVVALAPLLGQKGIRSVALVTSPYHQRRAGWTARAAWPGVVVYNRPAQPSSWHPEGWWSRRRDRDITLSEYAKLAYYAVRGWLF